MSAAPGGDDGAKAALLKEIDRIEGEAQFYDWSQGTILVKVREAIDRAALSAPKQVEVTPDGWMLVPKPEFRAMLHYTECYAEKFPSSGARETVGDYFETLLIDAATPQPVEAEGREVEPWGYSDGVRVTRSYAEAEGWRTMILGDVIPLYTTPQPEQPAIERLNELMAKARALVESMESGDDSRSQFIALKLAIIDGAKAGRSERSAEYYAILDAGEKFDRTAKWLTVYSWLMDRIDGAKAGRVEGEEG